MDGIILINMNTFNFSRNEVTDSCTENDPSVQFYESRESLYSTSTNKSKVEHYGNRAYEFKSKNRKSSSASSVPSEYGCNYCELL